MGDNRTDLPEGTDTIIAGASNTDDAAERPEPYNGDQSGDRNEDPRASR